MKKLLSPVPRQHFRLDPSGAMYVSDDDRVMEVDDGHVAQLIGLGCIETASSTTVILPTMHLDDPEEGPR